MSVLNTSSEIYHTQRKMFFDDPVDIARYDMMKYPQFEKLTDKQKGFYWRPEEVNLVKDSKDFKHLEFHEQHIASSNLKRQIILDSVQGRAPSLAFLPICSLPEIENFIQTWTFFETIHSKSYTHILKNVYPNPSIIFDEMLEIKELVDCAKDISKYYDNLINWNSAKHVHENRGWFESFLNWIGLKDIKYNVYEHKKALWLALNAVNALEGVRFYGSFACSWAFAELKKLVGNATIIKFICRDENVHLAFTQQILKLLPKDDPDFAKLKIECESEVLEMFQSVIQQEKDWAKYVFQYGSIIGLNEEILCEYIDWIAAKRMTAIGIRSGSIGSNPLPWTQKWISGADVQVAPQEKSITSYIIGGVKQDVSEDTFKGFEL